MPQRPSTSTIIFLLIAAFSAALAGCGSIQPPPPTPEQQAEQLEPMLSAAGFRMLPADTPERQKQLESLLPLQVLYYVGKTGTLHYYMADPFYCKCMYVGSEENYQKYERLKLNQQLVSKGRRDLAPGPRSPADGGHGPAGRDVQSIRHGPGRPDGPRDVLVIFFPSPEGRGFKVRDLAQRTFFARDSRFCFRQ